MTTLKALLQKDHSERCEGLTPSRSDGPVLGMLKWLLHWNCLHWPYRRFADCWVERRPQKEYEDEEARSELRYFTALYQLLCLAVIVALYFVFFNVVQLENPFVVLCLGAVVIGVTIFRFADMYAAILFLFSGPTYSSPQPMRSVANLFVNYVELTVGFASLYLLAFRCGDSFVSEQPDSSQFVSHLFTPVYFSFVTIATLGYGDFSPTRTFGQSLVVFEVLLGLSLLVVVLQRVLGASNAITKNP